MALKPFCILQVGRSPLVAAAIHHGHDVRPDLERLLALDEHARLREEDPWTGAWTGIAKTQIIGLRSRFEVDFNRPRNEAVYRTPEQAWGLSVWKSPLGPDEVEASLQEYDDFYSVVGALLRELLEAHRHVVVFDLHTYNHRRRGALSPPLAAVENPEVNIGTGTMDRRFWAPIVERFEADLRSFDCGGRRLDVRENVRFMGGHFGRWIHQSFPRRVCAIAIEIKKTFMDEWTGAADLDDVERICTALRSTVPGVLKELDRL